MMTQTLVEPVRRPASYYQRDWVRACADGRSFYSLPLAWDLTGPLDVDPVRAALAGLTARHSALRTAFRRTADDVEQLVWPSVEVDLRLVDMSSEIAPDAAADARIVADAERPRDLDQPPLWHGLLIRLGHQRHVLALFIHHLIFDGWSHGVLHDELVRCYGAAVSGRAPRLPELRLQFGDHATAERSRRDVTREEWWSRRLRALPPLGPLPPLGGSFISAPIVGVSAAQTEALRELAARQGAGLNAALLATLLTARRPHTGDDVVIGITRAGRDRPHLHRVVGPLLDHLPVRVNLARSTSFPDLVRRVHQAYQEAVAYQLPLGRIRQVVPDDLASRGQRLFDTRYNYLPSATSMVALVPGPDGAELRVAPRAIDPIRLAPRHTEDHPEVLPLSYVLRRQPNGALGGEVCGHDLLYPSSRLAAVATEFTTVLTDLVRKSG